MIGEIVVSNFRSLGRDIQIRPGRLSFLVGPNGSGKFNVLDVLSSVNQLLMTRKIDSEMVRKADVPSFGSLERGLRFLSDHLAETGAVYP